MHANVEVNPSFLFLVENVKNFPNVNNGKVYLNRLKGLLLQSEVSFHFEKDIYDIEVGNQTFNVLEAPILLDGERIVQHYICTISNGFMVSFILTFSNNDERKELYNIINEVKIQETLS